MHPRIQHPHCAAFEQINLAFDLGKPRFIQGRKLLLALGSRKIGFGLVSTEQFGYDARYPVTGKQTRQA
jgi:hypothetical protein